MATLTGTGGPDTLTGTGDPDVILGLAGNDRLVGGQGYDTLFGGPGNDVIDASSSNLATDFQGDDVRPGLGANTIIGSQTIFDAGDGIDIGYAEFSGVGGITFTVDGQGAGTAISGDGRINDTFTWAHYFLGTQQNDRFIGGVSLHVQNWVGFAGRDTFEGSAGFDRIDYGLESEFGGTGAVTVNLGTGTANDAFGDTDVLRFIDGVWGTDGGDRLSAGGLAREVEFLGAGGNDTLFGGVSDDDLFGGTGNDTLYGGAGNDRLGTDTGVDIVIGGAGTDTVRASFAFSFINEASQSGANVIIRSTTGDQITFREVEAFEFTDSSRSLAEVLALLPAPGQTIVGSQGNDSLTGGTGGDLIRGLGGADFLDGNLGADTLEGGLGNDFYIVDNAGDIVRGEIGFSQGGGIDTVRSFVDYTQPTNIELVRLATRDDTRTLNATGNDAPGTLVGNAGDNRLTGRGGNDQINGNDGDDVMTGNTGRDTLVGGQGADTFIYTAVADSRTGSVARDVINGFDRGADRIDLAAIDANTRTFGEDDAFNFIGSARFTGTAGELRTQGLGGPNAVLVEGDVNGDGRADLHIFVNLTTFMTTTDFIL